MLRHAVHTQLPGRSLARIPTRMHTYTKSEKERKRKTVSAIFGVSVDANSQHLRLISMRTHFYNVHTCVVKLLMLNTFDFKRKKMQHLSQHCYIISNYFKCNALINAVNEKRILSCIVHSIKELIEKNMCNAHFRT